MYFYNILFFHKKSSNKTKNEEILSHFSFLKAKAKNTQEKSE